MNIFDEIFICFKVTALSADTDVPVITPTSPIKFTCHIANYHIKIYMHTHLFHIEHVLKIKFEFIANVRKIKTKYPIL